MGKRGPQKTPTAILKIHGSRLPEHRKEPAIVKGNLKCPDDLKGYGRKYWNKHIRVLDQMGVISIQDLEQFRLLCEAQQDYNETRGHIDYYLRMKLRAECFKLAAHFGLTPSTRADVPHESKDNDTPFQKMVGAG